MDAQEYNEEFKKNAIRDYVDSYNQVRYMLAGDMDMLQEHHGWEEGETISDKIYQIYNSNQSAEVYSGFAINNDFKVQWADDDSAYIEFEVSSNEKWIVGQRGEVAISYGGGIDKFEGFGWGHEDSEFFQAIASTTGLNFENMKLEITEDEMDERLQVELGVDTAAEWLLENGHESNGDMVSYKSFVGALEMFEYNANDAAAYLLEQGEYNVDDMDDVVYGKADFIADIEMHVESIEKLKLQSDWDDVVRLFNVDEDKIVNFDADYLEDELEAEFPEKEPEPEVKKTRTHKPGM